MTLTNDQIRKVAKLARIRVLENELEGIGQELSSILHWIDQLQQVDVNHLPPYSEHIEHTMLEREDIAEVESKLSAVLQNAPEKAHNMFAVPKVVE